MAKKTTVKGPNTIKSVGDVVGVPRKPNNPIIRTVKYDDILPDKFTSETVGKMVDDFISGADKEDKLFIIDLMTKYKTENIDQCIINADFTDRRITSFHSMYENNNTNSYRDTFLVSRPNPITPSVPPINSLNYKYNELHNLLASRIPEVFIHDISTVIENIGEDSKNGRNQRSEDNFIEQAGKFKEILVDLFTNLDVDEIYDESDDDDSVLSMRELLEYNFDIINRTPLERLIIIAISAASIRNRGTVNLPYGWEQMVAKNITSYKYAGVFTSIVFNIVYDKSNEDIIASLLNMKLSYGQIDDLLNRSVCFKLVEYLTYIITLNKLGNIETNTISDQGTHVRYLDVNREYPNRMFAESPLDILLDKITTSTIISDPLLSRSSTSSFGRYRYRSMSSIRDNLKTCRQIDNSLDYRASIPDDEKTDLMKLCCYGLLVSGYATMGNCIVDDRIWNLGKTIRTIDDYILNSAGRCANIMNPTSQYIISTIVGIENLCSMIVRKDKKNTTAASLYNTIMNLDFGTLEYIYMNTRSRSITSRAVEVMVMCNYKKMDIGKIIEIAQIDDDKLFRKFIDKYTDK